MKQKKYTDSLNLPITTFPMRANLAHREPALIKFWDNEKIYKRMNEQRKKGTYILHDGPPYANGHIHIGHSLNKILKDIVLRQKNLLGFKTPYIPGWDCHGLPIEQKVEEKLGDKKNLLSKVKIRELCADYALKFVDIQRTEFKRLGILADWQNPYLTMQFPYEVGILQIFKKLYLDGYITKRLKPIYWCTHCKTALAEAEIEYEEDTSPAIYVKFEYIASQADKFFDKSKKYYFVIWTTTPWTLPANVAIALHPDYDYSFLDFGNEVLIIAKDLVPGFVEMNNLHNFKEVNIVKGKNLEGLSAKHPFVDRRSKIVNADYVTLESGTGCVHIAPGHGEEDYIVGLKYGLPIISPVDATGVFTTDAGKYAGKFVLSADEDIINDLKDSGHLVGSEKITHSYPHCWRCKKPIIFRATSQWFISIDKNKLRDKSINEIDKVKWIPSWGKKRIHSMVENRPDWCISRQRAWGVPIPVFYCKDCGKIKVTAETLEHFINIVKKEGSDAWFKYDAAHLLPKDYKCPDCGSREFEKETDILDVWFDSGSSFNGVLNKRAELKFPAGLYLEGSDQHRGWFQSSLILSMITQGRAPYNTVLTHGFVVDQEGKKMSKSVGNVISPQDTIKKYGADVVRLWVASSDYRDDIKISDEIINRMTDAYRKIRNTTRFILGNINDLTDFTLPEPHFPLELDGWILSQFELLKMDAASYYEKFEFYKVYQSIYKFCTVELSALYFDIVKDRLYVEAAASETRLTVQRIIYHILHDLTIMLSPILSFTSEEIWQTLRQINKKLDESVQFADYPAVLQKYTDLELNNEWTYILSVREVVQKALEMKRQTAVIGHSLDAQVFLFTQKKIHPQEKELADIFVVSDVVLLNNKPKISDAQDEINGIYAFVKKAPGKKCGRCWKYSEYVGTDEKYEEVCERCAAVLKDMEI